MKKVYKTISLLREQVYEEVWNTPLTALAKKYSLNYSLLSETLRRNNVPYPGPGFWIKKKLNKVSESNIIPLPEGGNEYLDLPLMEFHVKNEVIEKQGTSNNPYTFVVDENVLSDINKDDRKHILETAETIMIDQKSELHPRLIEYKENIRRYRKKTSESIYYTSHDSDKPSYIDDLSSECLERVILILNALFKAVEELGGTVNERLDPVIHSDAVTLKFRETTKKVKRDLTTEEKNKMKKDYSHLDEASFRRYFGIRKYEEEYTGKLWITIGNDNRLFDTGKWKIEDRLGEILILMYEEAQRKMEKRLLFERIKQRIADAQKQFDEELEIRIGEVEKTKRLLNRAEDYATACMIREYIAAMERKSDPPANPEWIKWAKEKADWYDPSIAYDDPVFGKRRHAFESEQKSFDQYMKREKATLDNQFTRDEIIEMARKLDISPYLLKYKL